MLCRHVFGKISCEFRGILRVFGEFRGISRIYLKFAAPRPREISEALSKKNKPFRIKEKLPSTRVIKRHELAHKRSVKRPKCEKTSLVVGSQDPDNGYILNNGHRQRCKNPTKAASVVA